MWVDPLPGARVGGCWGISSGSRNHWTRSPEISPMTMRATAWGSPYPSGTVVMQVPRMARSCVRK